MRTKQNALIGLLVIMMACFVAPWIMAQQNVDSGSTIPGGQASASLNAQNASSSEESIQVILKLQIQRLEERIGDLENKLANLSQELRKSRRLMDNEAERMMTNAPALANLTGEWKLTDIMEDPRYKGWEIGFKVYILQQGNSFTAKGEKYWVNGKEIPNVDRFPLHITGFIEGNTIRAIYSEDGRPVTSCGQFIWTFQSPDELVGQYVSSFADTRGRSTMTRVR